MGSKRVFVTGFFLVNITHLRVWTRTNAALCTTNATGQKEPAFLRSCWASSCNFNAARQVGGAIGVAAFGALVSGVTAERIISGLNIPALTAAALLIIATIIAVSVRPKAKLQAFDRSRLASHRIRELDLSQ